jgi:hypothetical protein
MLSLYHFSWNFASGKTLRHALPITALNFLYYEVYGSILLHYSSLQLTNKPKEYEITITPSVPNLIWLEMKGC